MIVGLTSNMGGSSFTLEPYATHESEIVCDVVLVTSPVVGDYDLNSTVLTAHDAGMALGSTGGKRVGVGRGLEEQGISRKEVPLAHLHLYDGPGLAVAPDL